MLRQSYPLILVLFLSLSLGLTGGFVVGHEDSEFNQNKENKTLFLHSIYQAVEFIDYQIFKKAHPDLDISYKNHRRMVQKHSIALYLVNGFFSLLGLIFTFLTALRLSRDQHLALIATLILGTSFFWVTETHYPAVDMPLTALSITAFYLFLKYSEEDFGLWQKLVLAIVCGLVIATKVTGLLILLPFIFLAFTVRDFRVAIEDALIVSIGAGLVFLLSFIAKFEEYVARVFYISESMFSTGHFGLENPAGHTFIYHFTTSLFDKYGIVLSLLAILGFYFFYKKSEKKHSFYALMIFVIAFYFLMGLTKIEAPRYILPIIPFLAIASAYGLSGLLNFIPGKHTIYYYIVTLLLLGPNLSLAFKHNALMKKKHTYQQFKYKIVPEVTKGRDFIGIVFDPLRRFLPAGIYNTKEFKPSFLDCRLGERAINLNALIKKDIPLDMIVFSSFKHDRYIYDWRFQCKHKRRAYKNFENWEMVTINPYRVPRDQVPFSPQSQYSPNLPDLHYRERPGPYMEILMLDTNFAARFMQKCLSLGLKCKRTKGKDSYYLNNIQGISAEFIEELYKKSQNK